MNTFWATNSTSALDAVLEDFVPALVQPDTGHLGAGDAQLRLAHQARAEGLAAAGAVRVHDQALESQSKV